MDVSSYDNLVLKIKLADQYVSELQNKYRDITGQALKFFNNLTTQDKESAAEMICGDLRREYGVQA